MITLALLPFVLQGVAMFFDEFYFHRKRGLPLWERLGHPMDTLTVLFCFGVPFFSSFSDSIQLFVFAALFSSLFITKDEFVHSEHCEPKEQWLHSVLFVLHPLQFVSAALFWAERDGAINILGIERSFAAFVLNAQLYTVSLFFLYQLIYWNIIWQPNKQSTMTSITDSVSVGTQQKTIP